uniref:Uncharacterized protein n=1 Tax=Aegilops tauschii subsp. strangulata TaxID=200361 RepID=A0A453GV14_AEGTS
MKPQPLLYKSTGAHEDTKLQHENSKAQKKLTSRGHQENAILINSNQKSIPCNLSHCQLTSHCQLADLCH